VKEKAFETAIVAKELLTSHAHHVPNAKHIQYKSECLFRLWLLLYNQIISIDEIPHRKSEND